MLKPFETHEPRHGETYKTKPCPNVSTPTSRVYAVHGTLPHKSFRACLTIKLDANGEPDGYELNSKPPLTEDEEQAVLDLFA